MMMERIDSPALLDVTIGRQTMPDRGLHEPSKAPRPLLATRYDAVKMAPCITCSRAHIAALSALLSRRLDRVQDPELHEPRQVARLLLVARRWDQVQSGDVREDRDLEPALLGPRRRCVLVRGARSRVCLARLAHTVSLCVSLGKRCIVKGCMRQAYERTNNFCNNHYQELETGTFTGEIEDEDASADAAMAIARSDADQEQKGER